MNVVLPRRFAVPFSAFFSGLSFATAALFVGCGAGPNPGNPPVTVTPRHTWNGSVHGGQQPIAGATLQLYAAGSNGTASAARALLPGSVTTNANGGFSITGLYTCNPGDEVYLVGTGGDAGAGTNPAIALMAALGPCASLQANAAATFTNVDEVTTVASVFSLAPFMSGIQNVGSDADHAQALAAAMANTLTMVDLAGGQALVTSKGNGIVPQTTINSLANALASCINSTAASGACTSLFNATAAQGTAPTDTVGAALNVALNPAANPEGVFLQASPTPPFQPTLTLAPASYALRVLHPSDVLLYHNDIARSGVQAFESTLTPANVNSAHFGKLATYSVDSYLFAQPLYLGGLGMPDGAVHNLLIAATTHATVYAFDADGTSSTPLWTLNYIPAGERYPTAADYAGCGNPPEAGIVGTPVIDRATQTMYFVVKSVDSATGKVFTHRLHAVSLLDGREQAGSPQVIHPTFQGNGQGNVNGTIAFNAQRQNNRSALLLTTGVNGAKTVWIAYASHCDFDPYHGILLGFSSTDLAQPSSSYIDTANGSEGGYWGSNGGPAADAQGNIYELSGNGSFDLNTGGVDSGDSAVRLVPPDSGSASKAMSVADSFTPSNQQSLSQGDQDFGGTEPLLFSDPASGVAPHLLVGSDKAGHVYLINADNMGRYDTGTNGVDSLNGDLQDFPVGGLLIYNFSFFQNTLYTSNPLSAYRFVPGSSSTPGHFNTTPLVSQPMLSAPVISANATADPLLWAQSQAGVLYVYTTSLTELYDSTQAAGGRDTPPTFVKFTSPVIANGRVFVSGQGAIAVYGLLP